MIIWDLSIDGPVTVFMPLAKRALTDVASLMANEGVATIDQQTVTCGPLCIQLTPDTQTGKDCVNLCGSHCIGVLQGSSLFWPGLMLLAWQRRLSADLRLRIYDTRHEGTTIRTIDDLVRLTPSLPDNLKPVLRALGMCSSWPGTSLKQLRPDLPDYYF